MKPAIATESLPDNNKGEMLTLSPKDLQEAAMSLLILLMEVSDDIASGHNTWFSWGATKEKTAFTATLYQYAGPLTIYDTNAVSLLRRVAELL